MNTILIATITLLVGVIILEWILFNDRLVRNSEKMRETQASNYRMTCRLEAVRLAEEEASAKRSAAISKGNRTRKAMKAAK